MTFVRKFLALDALDKFEETPDGDLIVSGTVATDALDNDQQRLDPNWLKSALPAWFDTAANIRAQHPKGLGVVAAGIGLDLKETEPGKWSLKALVVDEDAKMKVRKGVYQGFSVGMKSLLVDKGDKSVPNGWIRGGRIVEVSLVDRPCNDQTLFDKTDNVLLAKSDGEDGPLEIPEPSGPPQDDGSGAPGETPGVAPAPIGDAPGDPPADKAMSPDDRVYSAIQGLEQAVEWVTQAQQDDPDAGDDPNDKAVAGIVTKISTLVDQLKTAQHKDMAGEPAGKSELTDAQADEIVTKADAAMLEIWPHLTPDFVKAIHAVGRGNAGHDSIRKHIIDTTTKSEEDDDMNLLELLGIDTGLATKASEPDATLEDRLAIYAELQKALGIDPSVREDADHIAEMVKAVESDVNRIKQMDSDGGRPVRAVLTPAQHIKSTAVKSIEAEIDKMESTARALTDPAERRQYGAAIAEKRAELRGLQADLPEPVTTDA